jgi:glycosyltransferase involved in cell wall biosynthesis
MLSVNSVLSQTIDDLEVIIVDDGSSDESVAIIREIKDPRVKSIILPANTGGAAALNTGIKNATSDFIALCNCDDEWLPNKLEKQFEVLESSGVDAVFSDVFWIDELGNVRPNADVADADVFTVENRTKGEWLKFLIGGNHFCHPSILIRRKIYDELGLYDNRYRQLPDYDMWLRVIQNYNIFVMPERLVRFRIFESLENTSSIKPDNALRDANENALILENFFRNLSEENFMSAFGSRKQSSDPAFCLPLEKIFYLATEPFRFPNMLRHLALKFLYEFWETPEAQSAIAAYGEDYQFIYTLSGISSPFRNVRPLMKMTAKEWRKMMDWAGFEQTAELSPDFSSRYLDDETRQAEEVIARTERLQEKLDATRNELENRENRISELKNHIQQLDQAMTESAVERDSLHQALNASYENTLALQREIVELKTTLSEMGNSRSWKMTAPLRGFRSKTRQP